MDNLNLIADAIDRMGGQTAAAQTLQCSQGLVWQWTVGRRPVGPKHCPVIERLTGVRCEALRPDLIWTRDNAGQITGHHIPLNPAA